MTPPAIIKLVAGAVRSRPKPPAARALHRRSGSSSGSGSTWAAQLPRGRTFSAMGYRPRLFQPFAASSRRLPQSWHEDCGLRPCCLCRVMMSIKSCAKCGGAICLCGFLAALVVSVFGDGKPPPSRAVGPITGQFSTTTVLTSTVTLTAGGNAAVLTVADEITGRLYSAPWSQKQQQELDAPPLPPASSVS
jgi:hypothetical protein